MPNIFGHLGNVPTNGCVPALCLIPSDWIGDREATQRKVIIAEARTYIIIVLVHQVELQFLTECLITIVTNSMLAESKILTICSQNAMIAAITTGSRCE